MKNFLYALCFILCACCLLAPTDAFAAGRKARNKTKRQMCKMCNGNIKIIDDKYKADFWICIVPDVQGDLHVKQSSTKIFPNERKIGLWHFTEFPPDFTVYITDKYKADFTVDFSGFMSIAPLVR